jgi:molybdopterin molybdotransferase
MISVAAAKKIIKETCFPLQPIEVALQDAGGMALAADIYSSLDIPAFKQSSVDGYAFSFEGWQQNQILKIEGEMAAGDTFTNTLLPQHAIRIFTGAAVPDGADSIVMQEKISVENGMLKINDAHLKQGGNLRPMGSEIKAGELALEKGTILSPAAIGYLAGFGIDEVLVFPKPVISIIVTGKELQQPGKPLAHGQVYESNSYTLSAALQQLGLLNVKIYRADDNLPILTAILQDALLQSDVVLLTGGISVGDYDFVLQAATNCGISKCFHRIKQRPGKPMYFGNKNNQLVFGLPGNPSSVLTCFYEYVIPALQQLSCTKKGIETLIVSLGKSISKPAGLTCFLKGSFDGKRVTALGAQESYRLSSFAKANCLIMVDEAIENLSEGDKVEIHLLPF